MQRLARSLAAALSLVAVAACQSATTPEAALESARARWGARGPTSYAVTVMRSCECLPEASGSVRVTVRAKVVESRVYTSSGAPVPVQFAGAFPSVEQLFAMIDEAVRRGEPNLDVKYDPALGYPTRFVIGNPAADAPLLVLSDLEAR